jgi:hypothetical protein
MQLPNANVRASSYLIAETQVHCAQCSRACRVLALGLPPGHEILVDDEWQNVDANAFIFHVTALPESVSRLLLERSAAFHQTSSDDRSEVPWVNHCARCASVFSDDELHCEPGGFMPNSIDEAQAISVSQVEQPFSAFAAGYALDPEHFASMRRR